MGRLLSRTVLRRLYDRTGRRQDRLSFYSGPAEDVLCAHGAFEEAGSVFELGCGTGRLAARLLRERLPASARYVGVDLSGKMVEVAQKRLAPFDPRATVHQTDGRLSFDCAADSQDCVLSTYVLDLLPGPSIRAFLEEAHRLLRPSGRLCLAGLTWGTAPLPWLVSAAWSGLHALRPEWVGGCRPLNVRCTLRRSRWRLRHEEDVCAWGVPSTVVVAEPR